MLAADFQSAVLTWFDHQGRRDLPWQQQKSPYRVWISEIMLQQTQVTTVIPYFNKFMQKFANVSSLANAPLDAVLHVWSGLGYYARARNIHKTALIIDQQQFPDNLAALIALPGIGRSTAAAILSIAFHQSHAILDGNVKRLLSRFQGISGWSGIAKVNKELWATSTAYTPTIRTADYTQAMMDLGATICTNSNPLCKHCPLSNDCFAYQHQATTLLPTTKAKAKLPIKNKTLLLIQNPEQQVLLYKRPPIGIWGGLWSLPEFDNNELADSWYQQHYNAINNRMALPIQRHTFSHFHLDYQTLIVNIDHPVATIMEDQQMLWYQPDQMNLGLPAPIKKLITNLPSSGEQQ